MMHLSAQPTFSISVVPLSGDGLCFVVCSVRFEDAPVIVAEGYNGGIQHPRMLMGEGGLPVLLLVASSAGLLPWIMYRLNCYFTLVT